MQSSQIGRKEGTDTFDQMQTGASEKGLNTAD